MLTIKSVQLHPDDVLLDDGIESRSAGKGASTNRCRGGKG